MVKGDSVVLKIRTLLKCVYKIKILLVLIPVTIISLLISSIFNDRTKTAFSHTIYSFSIDDKDKGLEGFRKGISLLFLHYLASHFVSFLYSFCSMFVFKSFMVESLNRIIDLEYNDFHIVGSAKHQDKISRNGKAIRSLFTIVFFDLTWALFDIGITSSSLCNLLTTEYYRKAMCLFVVAIVVSIFTASYINRKEKKVQSLLLPTIDPLSDSLNNYDIVKSYGKEKFEISQYSESFNPYTKEAISYYMFKNIFVTIQKCALFIPHIYIVYMHSKGYNVFAHKFNVQIFSNYNSSFLDLKKYLMHIRDKIFSLFDYLADLNIDSKFYINEKIKKTEEVNKDSFDVEIKLKNVDLYAGNNLIQKGQSFCIKKGEKVAIIGMNGAGKSVFMKTLLKFFKHEGEIYIDDQLIDNISYKAMRNLISYVPQDPFIFNNTVFFNLSYSQTIKDESRVFEACKQFGLHDFFLNLKEGYETKAGERGKYLSGGQKQRISIMRGIIKDAPILLMDEPTANIDRKSETDLILKILKTCNNKTFMLIVHNPDMLKHFDKILYFDKSGISCYDSYESYTNKNN